MKLSDNQNRKFIEEVDIDGWSVLSEEGYVPIVSSNKTIKYEVYDVKLSNNISLKCADTHILIKDDGSEVYAIDSYGTNIKTNVGVQEVISVQSLGYEEEMYDFSVNSDEHVYYTNGILSHNTVTTSTYLLHQSMNRPNINVGIFANVMKLAKEVLDKIKKIYIQLPIWMQIGLTTWNKETLEFENGTRIMTSAANGDAFRGFAIDLLYGDEVAFIRSNLWEDIKDSVFPTQDSLAVHQTILSSTAKGFNQWYYLVKGARDNKNGYAITECKWTDVPRWHKDGSPKSTEDFKNETIDKKGALYFSQNFENNFLGSSDTMISTSALTNIEIQEPIYDKYINGLRVYKTVEKGRNYIISVDPSKDGIDDFSLHVIDVTSLPFEQVASANLQVDYLSMTSEIYTLGRTYNNAFIIIENNEGAGQSIVDSLWNTYEYENLYKDRVINNDKKFKKYRGFRTTVKTRRLILNLMKIFIENDKLIINDENTLYELQNFIKQDSGKFAADDGFKDDSVMALAISFAPLMSVRGFVDQEDFLKKLFSKLDDTEEHQDTSFSDVFTFGSFDDGTEENENALYGNNTYDELYEYSYNTNYPEYDELQL